MEGKIISQTQSARGQVREDVALQGVGTRWQEQELHSLDCLATAAESEDPFTHRKARPCLDPQVTMGPP